MQFQTQLRDIETNNLELTSYLTIKLANDLRSAVNETKTLYGADIFIAFKLVHHLLSYEAKQSGLNLTHKQDRYYLPNVVGIINAIVSTEYADHWERIGDRVDEGGPEHLLRLFNKYGEVLINNREDTFTEPFEFASENVIIGLDTIATDELWDMPYIESSSENRSSTLYQNAASLFVDHSLPPEVGAGVSLPKYNNYPLRKMFEDEVTRMVVPLKTLGVMPPEEAIVAAQLASFQIQRRNQPKPKAVLFYAIFPTLGQLLPDFFDHSIR